MRIPTYDYHGVGSPDSLTDTVAQLLPLSVQAADSLTTLTASYLEFLLTASAGLLIAAVSLLVVVAVPYVRLLRAQEEGE